MERQIYRLYGIEMAIQLLRPGAIWEVTNGKFTRWEDERPCPSMELVYETMEKIRAFEDSIPTIWLPEQINKLKKVADNFDEKVA